MGDVAKRGLDGEILEPELELKPPLCVWCSAPWTDDMMKVEAYAGGGCDTCGYGGEPHGTVTVTCSSCNRLVYQKDFDCGY